MTSDPYSAFEGRTARELLREATGRTSAPDDRSLLVLPETCEPGVLAALEVLQTQWRILRDATANAETGS